MKGIASLTTAAGGAPGFDLPFVVQGPWDDPLIFPDPESLIRRSPAVAPLLDALKDRKTRDAVKSVLERFTGGGVKPAAAPECGRGAGGWGSSGEVGWRCWSRTLIKAAILCCLPQTPSHGQRP